MGAYRSPMENIVRRMIKNGKSTSEIIEWTGVCRKTVARYRKEMNAEEDKPREKKVYGLSCYPPGFQEDWTVAVNRLRRYMGKRAFPMPKED